MERVNLTNLLVRIENVLCVYRNYSVLKTSAKRIVILRVFGESLVVLFTVVCFFYTFGGLASEVSNSSYILFSSVNSLLVIYLSCYKSNQFKEFVFNIKAVNKLLSSNTTYQSIATTQTRRVYIEITIFAAFFTSMAAYFLITSVQSFGNYFIIFEIALVFILEMRFYCVNLVFYELINVIVAPLEYLNASIGVVVERIKTGCGEEGDDVPWEGRRELEEWGAASQHLVTASDRLCDCFGVQITLSLFSTTMYLIMLLYGGVSSIVNPGPSLGGLDVGSIIYPLISNTVIKFLIVSSGQRVIRNGELLLKNLVMLHNMLSARQQGACARAAAGLARRLRAAPLRLRLLSSLTLQMALLAEILATVANYTIVLLQFNHVV